MAQVPWEVNRDRVEDAVAIMLLREHPDRDAQHRRGDGGDGGIDVYVPAESGKPPLVDVYQIKRFTESLGSAQWAQIRKSLITARDNAAIRIRTWYLVMPLNATAGDEKKLAELAEKLDVPFSCVWKGRSYLNGLASKHRSVIDVLFHDGQEHMARDRQQLYALLNLQKRATDPLTPQDLLGLSGTLKDLALGLNLNDPYYSYEIRFGKRLPLDIPQSLYMRQVIGGEGWFAAVDVYTEFPEAPLWSPVQEPAVTFSLTSGSQSTAVISEIKQSLAAGESVTLLPGEVRNLAFDGPGGLGGMSSTGTVRITPWRVDPAPPRSRWMISDSDGQVIAEAEIVFRPAVADTDGSFRLEGAETSGVFAVHAVAVRHDGHFDLKLRSLAVRDVSGRPVAEVAGPLTFLAALRAPHSLIVGFEEGSVLHETALPDPTGPVDPGFAKYVHTLAEIQQYVEEQISVPATPDEEQISDADQVHWVLTGKGLKIEGDGGLELTGRVPASTARRLAQSQGPMAVSLTAPLLRLSVGADEIALPETEAAFAAGHLVGRPQFENDGLAVVSVKAADNTVVITYSGQRPPAGRRPT